MVKITDDELIFGSSGRVEYQHAGIIGISSELRPTHGYDGGFNDEQWSQKEREELAEEMIMRWKRFALPSL